MDLTAYHPARSFPSKYSTRLRGFGRRNAFEGEASYSTKGETAAADVIVISSDEEERGSERSYS
jgi:hypothetical protein